VAILTPRGKIAFRTILPQRRYSCCYVTWQPHVIVVYQCAFVQVDGVLG